MTENSMTFKQMFEIARKKAYDNFCKRQNCIKPVTIDGKKYLIAIMHPRVHYLLKVLTARTKWYHECWVERYNRWRASRGESPYQEAEGEVGTFEGVNFKGVA